MQRVIIVLTLIAISSCAPKSSHKKNIVINTSIINGRDVLEKEAIANSVVGVFNSKKNTICSGTLIAPNIVLTAAHCAPERASNVKIVFSNDIDYIMNTREQDILQEYVLSAVDFRVGPSWDPKNESEVNTGDIALIKFKGTIPPGFKPAQFLADGSLLKMGAIVTVAGFGVNTVSTTKVDPKKYQNLEEAIAYGEVVCDDEANGAKINCVEVETNGDGILRTTEAPIKAIDQSEITLDEKKAGTCNGDSGGPAFIRLNGELYLFGVTSRGSALCNEVGVYTNALYFKGWINDTIKILLK